MKNGMMWAMKKKPYPVRRCSDSLDSTARRCREFRYYTARRCYEGTFDPSAYTARRRPSREAIYSSDSESNCGSNGNNHIIINHRQHQQNRHWKKKAVFAIKFNFGG